jgi:hypothetical protein
MPDTHPFNRKFAARTLLVSALVSALFLTGCSNGSNSSGAPGEPVDPPPPPPPPPPPVLLDRAHYILPPGNFGGFPNTTPNSFDQLPLYDGLTPLRGAVTDADIESLFLPEDFKPIGETREEATGAPARPSCMTNLASRISPGRHATICLSVLAG